MRAMLDGEPLEGYWFDRTQEFAARQRGEEYGRLDFAERETVTLSPLPCWENLPADEQRRRVARRSPTRSSPKPLPIARRPGLSRWVPQPFGSRIPTTNHSTRRSRRRHSSTLRARGVRDDLRADYYAFLAAFREAADRLKAGIFPVIFPAGSFPPALPFVPG